VGIGEENIEVTYQSDRGNSETPPLQEYNLFYDKRVKKARNC